MNVLIVTFDPVPKPNAGGPGAIVGLLKEAYNKLDKNNSELNIFFIHDDSKIDNYINIKEKLKSNNNIFVSILLIIKRLKLYNDKIYFTKKKIKQLLIENEIDIINAHDVISAYAAIMAMKELNINRKLITTIHSIGTFRDEANKNIILNSKYYNNYLRKIEESVYRNSDMLVYPSYGSMQYIDDYLLKDKKVEIIYNGISVKKPTKCRNDIRKKFNISENDIVFVSVGRLIYEKGFDRLIEIFKKLIDVYGENLKLLIIGDGVEFANLKTLINEKKLEKNIYLAGFRTDIPDILNASDVYISASRKAVFDLTVLEALVSGLPVVASNIGGNIEALENGKYGILIDFNDSRDVVVKLENLILNYRYRNKLSKDSYNYAIKKFSVEEMYNNYIKIYKIYNDKKIK